MSSYPSFGGRGIEAQRDKRGFWLTEDTAPGLRTEIAVKRILHSSKSEFQQIEVIGKYFGRTLVTDGKMQSSEFDEFVYHESLVHPTLVQCARLSGNGDEALPRSVF